MPRYLSAPLTISAAYIATVLLANLAVTHFGIVGVGFGLVAPAGVFFAGLAFILRDLLQRSAPRPVPWVLGAILAGTVVSLLLGTGIIALASAAAFLLSELADWAVYSPLRRRGFLTASVASNVVGSVIDSLIFLWIAFGSLAFLPGQVVGKLWVTLVFVVLYVAGRRAFLPRHS
jgi:uncharacterized PurR-regulated membrane protein YhhQ (DUF165 family)